MLSKINDAAQVSIYSVESNSMELYYLWKLTGVAKLTPLNLHHLTWGFFNSRQRFFWKANPLKEWIIPSYSSPYEESLLGIFWVEVKM